MSSSAIASSTAAKPWKPLPRSTTPAPSPRRGAACSITARSTRGRWSKTLARKQTKASTSAPQNRSRPRRHRISDRARIAGKAGSAHSQRGSSGGKPGRAVPGMRRSVYGHALYCQREIHFIRCAARYTVAVGDPRGVEACRHEIRLRRGTVRRLYGAYRRQARVFLPDGRFPSARASDHDHRRLVSRFLPSGAESLARRARPAMRLLPVGPNHERGGSVEAEPQALARADRGAYEHQYLPLRLLPEHHARHRAAADRDGDQEDPTHTPPPLN